MLFHKTLLTFTRMKLFDTIRKKQQRNLYWGTLLRTSKHIDRTIRAGSFIKAKSCSTTQLTLTLHNNYNDASFSENTDASIS